MNTIAQIRRVVFIIMVLVFIVLALSIQRTLHIGFPALSALGVIFGLFGLALIVLSATQTDSRITKAIFIINGASAVGIPISVVLHNITYRLCIRWFGHDFWSQGGDEPIFFILAIIIFPVMFVITALAGAAVLLKTGKQQETKKPQQLAGG